MVERARRASRPVSGLGPILRLLSSQFVAYGMAGSVAVVTHIAVLTILAELAGMPKTVASGIGFCCAIPVNYTLQHRFVFASNTPHHKAFVRYLATTFGALALNVALFHALLKTMSIHYVLAQLIVIGVVFVVNFTVNRAYTFANDSIREIDPGEQGDRPAEEFGPSRP